jgi:hypothetical protein
MSHPGLTKYIKKNTKYFDQGVTMRIYTIPFKGLASLRNVLVSERKAHFLSIKITSN